MGYVQLVQACLSRKYSSSEKDQLILAKVKCSAEDPVVLVIFIIY